MQSGTFILLTENMRHLYLFFVCFFGFLTILDAKVPAKSACLEKTKVLALLEIAEDFQSKAKISFPSCSGYSYSTDQSECSGKMSLAYIENSKKIISYVKENFSECSKVIEQFDNPRDCSEIYARGHRKNGVYTIWPTAKSLQVYCDMETEGTGWTVIQRRGKFPVQQDFDQDWETYKNGFGNIREEFWLGNENIRILCLKSCEIRFDLQDNNGTKGFAIYENFNLTENKYTLHITGYSGNVEDGMYIHNRYIFSTKDKGYTKNAMKYHGGWWHRDGMFSNLNGLYKPGIDTSTSTFWYRWRKHYGLAAVEIKVKPK